MGRDGHDHPLVVVSGSHGAVTFLEQRRKRLRHQQGTKGVYPHHLSKWKVHSLVGFEAEILLAAIRYERLHRAWRKSLLFAVSFALFWIFCFWCEIWNEYNLKVLSQWFISVATICIKIRTGDSRYLSRSLFGNLGKWWGSKSLTSDLAVAKWP